MLYVDQIVALDSLLQGVNAASGPDRRLDGEIWWAFADHSETDAEVLEWARDEGVQRALERFLGLFWAKRTDDRAHHVVPAFTASADAALALAEQQFPKTWHEILHEAKSDLSRRHAWHMCFAKPGQLQELPLAICAATLSAKLALLTQEEGQ